MKNIKSSFTYINPVRFGNLTAVPVPFNLGGWCSRKWYVNVNWLTSADLNLTSDNSVEPKFRFF